MTPTNWFSRSARGRAGDDDPQDPARDAPWRPGRGGKASQRQSDESKRTRRRLQRRLVDAARLGLRRERINERSREGASCAEGRGEVEAIVSVGFCRDDLNRWVMNIRVFEWKISKTSWWIIIKNRVDRCENFCICFFFAKYNYLLYVIYNIFLCCYF